MRKQQESLQTRKQIEKNRLGRRITILLVRYFKDQLNQVTGNNHQPQDHLTQQQDSMSPRDHLWPRRI